MKIQREQDYRELTTVVRFFEKCVERYPSNILMKEKRQGAWKEWTYAAIRRDAYAFGAGLRLLGFAPGDRIALLSEGRKDWLVSELGMFYARLVNVPLSVKLDPATEINFRLKHSGVKAVIVSQGQAQKIADSRLDETSVTRIINLDSETADGIRELNFKAICAMGGEWLKDEAHAKEMRDEVGKISPDDLANISYTSGTTSDPKGIMLTQRSSAWRWPHSCAA